MVGSMAGTTPAWVTTLSDPARYRLTIIVLAQNITDRAIGDMSLRIARAANLV